jgi:peptidoglycan hydrolase-like protein with peptidoglycan-binding domain
MRHAALPHQTGAIQRLQNWWVHQYQGDAVQLPGLPGTVDMNRFHAMIKGDQGERVKWVQRRLGMAASGEFDDGTLATVLAHQREHELVADGIVGPQTFASLCWGQ